MIQVTQHLIGDTVYINPLHIVRITSGRNDNENGCVVHLAGEYEFAIECTQSADLVARRVKEALAR